MTDVNHLPGCNLEHEGGNWAATCRRQVTVGYRPEFLTPENVATVTVEADGPCTGGAQMEISIAYRALSPDDLAKFDREVWPQIQQALAEQSAYLSDWEKRSQCQHPEDEDCPE